MTSNRLRSKPSLYRILCLSGKIWPHRHLPNQVFLDVRSHKEFLAKNLPLFVSAPLLDDQQHALIGTVYQQQGASVAMTEGFKLSQEYLTERLSVWEELTKAKQTFVTCFRGGLRSKIAYHYMQFFAKDCYQIEGGYKALRHQLLSILEDLDACKLFVLTGQTGSGKTRLLRILKLPGVIDLEHLAHHRGSAFGSYLQQNQPSQSCFENALLFELFCKKGYPLLVEDESRLIGHNLIPLVLKEKMKKASVIYLDVDLETRADHIFKEYVLLPLNLGFSRQTLLQYALTRLKTLEKRLGGQQFQVLQKDMIQAFSQSESDMDRELHLKYIRMLLETYYDKRYDHAFQRHKRQILFKGDFQECEQWLTTNLSD